MSSDNKNNSTRSKKKKTDASARNDANLNKKDSFRLSLLKRQKSSNQANESKKAPDKTPGVSNEVDVSMKTKKKVTDPKPKETAKPAEGFRAFLRKSSAREKINNSKRKIKKKMKEEKTKIAKAKKKKNDSDSDSDEEQTRSVATEDTGANLLVIEKVPKAQLAGAGRKLKQPTDFALNILREERPDLFPKDVYLEQQDAEAMDCYLRERVELREGDLIYHEDNFMGNIEEESQYYIRYKVNMQYSEGRYFGVYLVSKQLFAAGVQSEEPTMYVMKLGLRQGSVTIKEHLIREIQVMRMMASSTRFPKLVDFGKICDNYYITMNLLDRNLDKIRDAFGGRIKPATLFYVAAETLSAIHELHIKKYVHRDIKPTNFCTGFGKLSLRILLIDLVDACQQGQHLNVGVPDALTLTYWSCSHHKDPTASTYDMDIESWFYTICDLGYPTLLPWKYRVNPDQVYEMKQQFWKEFPHELTELTTLRKIAEFYRDKPNSDKLMANLKNMVADGFKEHTKNLSFVPQWENKDETTKKVGTVRAKASTATPKAVPPARPPPPRPSAAPAPAPPPPPQATPVAAVPVPTHADTPPTPTPPATTPAAPPPPSARGRPPSDQAPVPSTPSSYGAPKPSSREAVTPSARGAPIPSAYTQPSAES